MRMLQRWLLMLMLALQIFVPRNIFSCGPFFETATFSFDPHPDYPIKDYIAGKLGVLKPSFYRLFLVVAYRDLSGRPFARKELATLDGLLSSQAKSADEFDSYGMSGLSETETPPKPPARLWLEERAKITGDQLAANAGIDLNKPYGEYQTFLNCTDAAFGTAVQTLHERQQRWGVNSADLRLWIGGQDAVFANCSDKVYKQPAALATKNILLKQDRDYQIASALFYSGNPDQLLQARQEFDAIARDKTSPWSEWGSYLAARSLIRAATLKAIGEQRYDPKLMADAEAKLKGILSDRTLSSSHPAASKMLGFVEARINATAYTRELAQRLSNGHSLDLAQDLIDYRYMLDNGPSEPGSSIRQDDLTDWIRTFQAGAKEKDHAIAMWSETRSLPWLVAAITAVDASDPAASDLLSTAKGVDAHDPRLLSVLYRQVVLLRAMKKDRDSRALIDTNLEYLSKEAPISSRNLFWHERMTLAESFEEFLRFAPREDAEGHHVQAKLKDGTPPGPDDQNDVYFDSDSTSLLNRAIPLPMLVSAITRPELPKPLQSQVLQSTYTRALLLNKADIAKSVAPRMKQSISSLIPYIDEYDKEATDVEHRRSTLWILLHFPGLRPYVVPNMQRTTAIDRIDNYRDNWWCEDVGAKSGTNDWRAMTGDAPGSKTSPLAKLAFLNPEEEQQGASEWAALSKLGTAPNYLSAEVLAWAKATPNDWRIPEALSLVVRATRYGCTDAKTTSYSKQAFQLLHSTYPNDPWTKRTPYFY